MSPNARAGMSSNPGAAFDEFVSRGSPTLYRLAYLLIGDRGHAEDALQLALLRTAQRWQVAREAPDAYARRIIVNLSRDRYRHLSRRVPEYPLDEAVGLPLARDHADGLIGRETVIHALRALPVRQREVVVMRFFADLPVPDTAAALGLSDGTVKSHTSRALARLRELLADNSRTTAEQTTEVSGAD